MRWINLAYSSLQREVGTMEEKNPTVKVRSRIGSLHSERVYAKYKESGACEVVLGIISRGVPSFFLTTDIPKFPRGGKNNDSAKKQPEFVNETLKDWEDRGFIERIPRDKAKVILPLSVAHRWSHKKKVVKYRLVLDCSPFGDKLSYGRIKLPDLTYLRNQIRKGDYIGLIDITSFYLHFTLDPATSDMYCFEWDFGDGRGPVCYMAVVMLFGIPHAPWVVTKCTEVLVTYCRRTLDILINPFIDDFSHIAHAALEEAMRQFQVARKEIREWGFVISEEKIVAPAKENKILGFVVNTEQMTVKFDEDKLEEVRFLVEDAMQPRVPAKYLAKVVGKYMSMGYASKIPVACFLPRTIKAIATVTEEGDWRAWRREVEITAEIFEELLYVLRNIKSWNGVDIKKPVKMHYFSSECPIAETEFQAFIGDASQEAAAVYSLANPHKFSIQYFSESQAAESSSRRELRALELLIMEQASWIERGATVVYASDSTTLNRWVNCGSCKPDVAEALQRIFLRSMELGIDVRVTWVPRSHPLLEEADLLSRRSTDEFSLRDRDWDYVRRMYGRSFTLDVFGSKFLARAPRYFSKFPSESSAGTDGLHQPWEGEQVWMFPPRKMLGDCIRRILVEANLQGALCGLDNGEGFIRNELFPTGHAPPSAWLVMKWPVKVSMGYEESYSESIQSVFSNNWHTVVVIFFDTFQEQDYLPARCFQKEGKCTVCGGNKFVTDEKIPYS